MQLEKSHLGHTSPISGIASYGNKYIVTAGYDSNLILWDLKTKRVLSIARHDHLVNSCEFSSDGKYLVSSSSDYTARLWSVPDLKLVAVLGGHDDDVEMSSFSMNNKYIATASRDHKVRLFDTSGDLIHCFSGHEKDVLSVSWDENNIISSSDDGTLRVWCTKTYTCISVIELNGVETDTIAVISKNSVVAGNDNGEVLLFVNGEVKLREKVFLSGVKRLVYNQENNKILSLSYDKTLSVLEIDSNYNLKLISKVSYPEIVWARSATFLNKSEIALGTFGSCFAVYNIDTNKWSTNHIRNTRGINAGSVDGDDFYTVGDSGTIYKNSKYFNDVSELCNFIENSPESILTGGQSGKIYDIKNNSIVYRNTSPVNCCIYLEKYKLFAIGDYNGDLVLLKEDSSKITFFKKISLLKNAIKSLSSSNNQLFVVGAAADQAFLNLDSGKVNNYKEGIHSQIINDCTCLGNSKFATVSRDKLIKIHELDNIQEIKTPNKHSIKCIQSDSNGRFLATGSYSGFLGIYDMIQQNWVEFKKITRFGLSSISYQENKNQFLITSYDGSTYSENMELYI